MGAARTCQGLDSANFEAYSTVLRSLLEKANVQDNINAIVHTLRHDVETRRSPQLLESLLGQSEHKRKALLHSPYLHAEAIKKEIAKTRLVMRVFIQKDIS